MQKTDRIRSALVHGLIVLALGGSPIAAASDKVNHHHRVEGVARDHRGRILRSASAKDDFKKIHPCPVTGRSRGRCPGYVIDHIIPLACGGQDAPANMQWQTIADGKAKDKWERKGCAGQ